MTNTPPANINTLIEQLYAANQLRIILPERLPYVVTVFTNDSIKPRVGNPRLRYVSE